MNFDAVNAIPSNKANSFAFCLPLLSYSSSELKQSCMRASAWQALRTTSRSPVRSIAGRRYPQSRPKTRPFHSSSVALYPRSTPNSSQPLDSFAESALPQATPVGSTAELATQDGASKDLNNGQVNLRRPGYVAKRSNRPGRLEGLPPITFPTWFHDKNVILHGSRNDDPTPKTELILHLQLRDEQTPNWATLPMIKLPLHATYKDIRELCIKAWENGFALHRAEGMEEHEYKALVSSLEIFDNTVGHAHSRLFDAPPVVEEAPSSARNQKLNTLARYQVTAKMAACLDLPLKNRRVSRANTHTNMFLHSVEYSNDAEKVEQELMQTTKDIAKELEADIVSIEAQDIAELLGQYISESNDPSASNMRRLGYSAYEFLESGKENAATEMEQEDEEDLNDDDEVNERMEGMASFGDFLKTTLGGFGGGLGKPQIGGLKAVLVDASSGKRMPINVQNYFGGRANRPEDTPPGLSPVQKLKLSAWIESLIDLPRLRRDSLHSDAKLQETANTASSTTKPIRRSLYERMPTLASVFLEQQPDGLAVANQFSADITTLLPERLWNRDSDAGQSRLELKVSVPTPTPPESETVQKTIILVRDYDLINQSPSGQEVLSELKQVVERKRSKGESVMIVGTSINNHIDVAFAEPTSRPVLRRHASDMLAEVLSFERTSLTKSLSTTVRSLVDNMTSYNESPSVHGDSKSNEINIRHAQDMVKQLYPDMAHLTDPSNPPKLNFWSGAGEVLNWRDIQESIITAMGISLTQGYEERLHGAHLDTARWLEEVQGEILAESAEKIKRRRDTDTSSWLAQARQAARSAGHSQLTHGEEAQQASLEAIRNGATKHEKRLLGGVINPQDIKTTFSDVHAGHETVDALKTLTSLSLLRPEEFTYGVLATSKIPGILLYGPPGTGKTLLAKAVAKDTRATVLEVSGSEINDMYVGEGEKNVKAVFSLARKLSPCVVFIDEADALLSTRSRSEMKGHRETINQFLKEWDGMNEKSVFIMVATNRPFDLDDAVLRRLPRRILVDLPTKDDREKILQIHLKHESLDSTVSLTALAEETKLYSGSDLKNLCVAAALGCVKEISQTNVTAAPPPTSDGPPLFTRRVLHRRHFDKAMQEIGASISEDMSSLTQIRKFDERYGDKASKRKKSRWGFGEINHEREALASEKAVRVRG